MSWFSLIRYPGKRTLPLKRLWMWSVGLKHACIPRFFITFSFLLLSHIPLLWGKSYFLSLCTMCLTLRVWVCVCVYVRSINPSLPFLRSTSGVCVCMSLCVRVPVCLCVCVCVCVWYSTQSTAVAPAGPESTGVGDWGHCSRKWNRQSGSGQKQPGMCLECVCLAWGV